jgi:hypothetical protein
MADPLNEVLSALAKAQSQADCDAILARIASVSSQFEGKADPDAQLILYALSLLADKVSRTLGGLPTAEELLMLPEVTELAKRWAREVKGVEIEAIYFEQEILAWSTRGIHYFKLPRTLEEVRHFLTFQLAAKGAA